MSIFTHSTPNNPVTSLPPVGRGRGGGGQRPATNPPQGRPRLRVGAAAFVLGTLPLNPSRNSSAGVTENAPSRGEGGRGPAAHARLDSGRGGASGRGGGREIWSLNDEFEQAIS